MTLLEITLSTADRLGEAEFLLVHLAIFSMVTPLLVTTLRGKDTQLFGFFYGIRSFWASFHYICFLILNKTELFVEYFSTFQICLHSMFTCHAYIPIYTKLTSEHYFE